MSSAGAALPGGEANAGFRTTTVVTPHPGRRRRHARSQGAVHSRDASLAQECEGSNCVIDPMHRCDPAKCSYSSSVRTGDVRKKHADRETALMFLNSVGRWNCGDRPGRECDGHSNPRRPQTGVMRRTCFPGERLDAHALFRPARRRLRRGRAWAPPQCARNWVMNSCSPIGSTASGASASAPASAV